MSGGSRLLHRAWLGIRHARVVRRLAELEIEERLSRDEILDRQNRKLKDLLIHAGEKIPFYRKAFSSAGIDPARARAEDSLAALPVVTKDLIRERGAEFLSSDAPSRGATPNATGGSTGQPLVFHQDDEYRMHRQAVMYRGFRWCGWRLGGPLAYLWGSDVDSKSHRGLGALRDALFGITWIDAFTLEERQLDGILDRLAAASPDIFIGYASSLHHLARRALDRGGGPRLKAVETSAELLTEEARGDLGKAFGCKVFDRYGCREAGVVSHECGAGEGWHINTETAFLETEAGGTLLLTTLMNYSMPLIRYRNDDIVELSSKTCPCGRNLPMMVRVVGRRADIILSPSGRAIHGEFFTHLFYGVPGVREFQVVQTTPADLVIRVVAGAEFTADHRSRIESAIRDHGDAAFRLRWESLAAIPRERSGKFRFTLSEIGAPSARERPL